MKAIRLLYLLPFLLFSCTSMEESEAPLTSISFGSCAKQWMPQPIWNSIAQENPDVFIFLGDAIYGDWNDTNVFEVSEHTLDRDYGKLGAIPEFRAFRSTAPVLALWDNHDYGSHNGGIAFEHKELTKRKFLDFFEEPENSERRRSPGIYDSKIYGPKGKRVQVILLDTRWFKSDFKLDTLSKEQRAEIGKVGKYSPNTDAGATLLGEAQWTWLEEQLKMDADIRLVCSSTQVIPNQKGMDEWGDYPKDRAKLLDLLSASTGYSLILSGNVHFAEFSTLNWRGKEIVEFTSSGLTHINELYGMAPNKYRLGKPLIKLNFGLLEIDWENQLISLQMKSLDSDSNEHTLAF